MAFELRALPIPERSETAYWFVFEKEKLLIENKNGKAYVPFLDDTSNMNLPINESIYLGRLDSYPCFSASVPEGTTAPEGWFFIGLRQLFTLLPEDMFWLAARAYHLSYWDKNTKYCGRCGSKTQTLATEHAKSCPDCGFVTYTRISPAIIVAITKGDQLLLAQGKRFTSKFYSILAGFVEPGENLEDCVRREVMEEVGINVKNIRYFGSQPWPFPDSLMLGFTAEYAGGELVPDPGEIGDAGWFDVDSLPQIPSSISIARKLIDDFIQSHKR
ncbi:MAG TPA: NAD(+) diphosphatase [Negativicutes bacterium]|nr:NAD(+) diphosphatase [Negativicutes bacterium]